jgi:hypothetical protein
MDEARKIKEEDMDAGLTTATLAGASTSPEVRVVAPPSSGVGGGSSAGVATVPAPDKQVMPLFSAEETKDFRGGGIPCR